MCIVIVLTERANRDVVEVWLQGQLERLRRLVGLVARAYRLRLAHAVGRLLHLVRVEVLLRQL